MNIDFTKFPFTANAYHTFMYNIQIFTFIYWKKKTKERDKKCV